jgi:hypothetical protein
MVIHLINNPTHTINMVSCLLILQHGHDGPNKPTPPLGSSLEGVGQGWGGRILFSLMIWLRRKNRGRLYVHHLKLCIIQIVYFFMYFACPQYSLLLI